ncbi:MAG: hydrogenase expression protein HypE [Acetobacteraceae bacterium]|nr:hydrogenase expression protein HypE [Acetobacteraceae bacterium]
MTAAAIIASAGAESCHPWPRHILTPTDWAAMAAFLVADPSLALVGLWADTTHVHALFLTEAEDLPLLASVPVEAGAYTALSPARPGAAWFERLIHDLWGHAATGGMDARPWLDHGLWPHSAPLSPRPVPPPAMAEPPDFLPPTEDGLFQLPIGPIIGCIDDAWHLRLTLRGETVERAEARLGYTHKGTLALMRGKPPRTAARFVARLGAEATVAHSLAFALATEAALAVAAPPRAATLRRMMGELERITVHLGDLALLGDAAGAPGVAATCGEQRELLARELEIAFGHRLMMDCVVPGGVAADVGPEGMRAVRRGVGRVVTALPGLRRLLESSACLTRLVGLGRVDRQMVHAFAAGGVAGRASGRRFDARQLRDERSVTAPIDTTGDAAARCRLQLVEIESSLRLLGRLLDTLPDGGTSVALPMLSGEGIGCAESARGDVWHWLRLDHGQIAAAFPRDPGWALWPLAEWAMQGAALEDVPAIQRSFGLTASGADL